ncbi:3'-5' exonuclease [Acinetobacter baumannii]|uniref:3'-5' exonuclease n=1 Tax=Acinetobacter baumannii TaxID=470 RepID=UPI001CA8DF80|nr:3'-5' exonuclease [Acinetobacter baumannii]UAB18190.1 3'-5' exonuclease [Acinetobacter baumannii]
MIPYILGVDTETTGLEVDNGDKIIEIALIKYDLDGAKLEEFVQRIDPERNIDPKAQAVHGISYSDLIGCPKFVDIAEEVASIVNHASLLVAHNFAFDGPFIATELKRAGITPKKVSSFCTMEYGRWATFDGKYPKLADLCFSLGVEYDASAAHAASYDVDVMMQCFFKARERGFFQVEV